MARRLRESGDGGESEYDVIVVFAISWLGADLVEERRLTLPIH